jgi:hypothetical protein
MKCKKTISDSVQWVAVSFILFFITDMATGETVGVFRDPATPQHTFAAGDIQTALEAKGFTVEIKDLSTLSDSYTAKKVVIALASNATVTALLAAQGGSAAGSPGEQAYSLRTTTTPQLSYWVLGGDDNGAMYGGLQIAENISFSGFTNSYNQEESPYIKKRGIKFNIPLDKDCPTYYYDNDGTSHQIAIRHVWDMSFWTEWFDEMARHRYNALSLWSPHPFTAMLNMEDEYPGIAIQGVKGYDENGATITINNMTIDQKVVFWQNVMQYGRNRGFDIYFITWNIFLSTAKDKYGMTNVSTDPETRVYLRKCMKKFLETYPNLTGFGITVGENMGNITNAQKEEWAWDTYGLGMKEYAQAHPERNLEFIHRQHQGTLSEMMAYFQPLSDLPNVQFDISFKYSQAHAHAAVKPTYWGTGMTGPLDGTGNVVKSWLTVRNDDWYFLHWADPQYVRDYVNNLPEVGKYIAGFYIGSDGWVGTLEFTHKNPYYKNKNALSIQKTWYMQKLWGRLSYNPNVSDDLFKNHLALKYPEVSSEQLFQAWSKASRAVRLANEQVTGTWSLDFHWWPEGWTSDGGFLSLTSTRSVVPQNGSNLCSFTNTAINNCSGKVSALTNASQIEQLSQESLSILGTLSAGSNTELMLNMKDLEAMSYLGLYNANKFRAAVYLEQGDTTQAKNTAYTAYGYWQQYTNLMDSLYRGVALQRNHSFNTWHDHDADAWNDYNGIDAIPPTPNPAQFAQVPSALSPTEITMTAVTGTDNMGSVQYLFKEAGGRESGWQSSPVYIDINLQPATQYTYTVTMRDSAGNETTPSAPFSAFTNGDPDIVKNYSIDLNDFMALAMQWLEMDCFLSAQCAGTDLNVDGAVDLEDFRMLAVSWQIQLTPPPPGFQERGGMIVFEAEHYDNLRPSQDGGNVSWALKTDVANPLEGPTSNGEYMYVGTNSVMANYGNFSQNVLDKAPRLDYMINAITGGTYYIWVRGNENPGNSVFVVADFQSTAAAVEGYGSWVWWNDDRFLTPAAQVTLTAGVHTISVYQREDRCGIDKLILTRDSGYIPTLFGPSESSR